MDRGPNWPRKDDVCTSGIYMYPVGSVMLSVLFGKEFLPLSCLGSPLSLPFQDTTGITTKIR